MTRNETGRGRNDDPPDRADARDESVDARNDAAGDPNDTASDHNDRASKRAPRQFDSACVLRLRNVVDDENAVTGVEVKRRVDHETRPVQAGRRRRLVHSSVVSNPSG